MKKIYMALAYAIAALLIAYAVVAYIINNTSGDLLTDGFGRKQYVLPEGWHIHSVPNVMWLLFDAVIMGIGFLAAKFFYRKATD